MIGPCSACANSQGSPSGLICIHHNQPAVEVCDAYEREPGTDSEELSDDVQ